MARQVRIEYPGAMYHAMARGDRREPIYQDDGDRSVFLETLEQACLRSGVNVHAYVLMPNHYHLAIETPEGNLVEFMRWVQNTYTRRFNGRHRLWGHLFGDRYKAVVVDGSDPDYFPKVLDYIHLNAVRAGLVRRRAGLETYRWSSLRAYGSKPSSRPEWLRVKRGFAVVGVQDTPRGRRAYLERLEAQVDWTRRQEAGHAAAEAKGGLNLQATLRRGWYFGSQAFKESLLARAEKKLGERRAKAADGYRGTQFQDHGLRRAGHVVEAALKMYGVANLAELRAWPCNDPRKLVVAEVIRAETGMGLDWIRNHLRMGDRAYCSRLLSRQRTLLKRRRKARSLRETLVAMSKGID